MTTPGFNCCARVATHAPRPALTACSCVATAATRQSASQRAVAIVAASAFPPAKLARYLLRWMGSRSAGTSKLKTVVSHNARWSAASVRMPASLEPCALPSPLAVLWNCGSIPRHVTAVASAYRPALLTQSRWPFRLRTLPKFDHRVRYRIRTPLARKQAPPPHVGDNYGFRDSLA